MPHRPKQPGASAQPGDSTQPRSGVTQRPEKWMAQGEAVTSGILETHLKADAETRDIRRIASDILAFAAPSERVERLKAEFAGRAVIERDAPVWPGQR